MFMPFSEIFAFLRLRISYFVSIGIVTAVLAVGILVVIQPRYSSSMDFLLVQENTSGQDFYTVFKSSEYLGKVLTRSMYSERFIVEVIATGKMDDRFLPSDKKDRLDAWEEILTVRNNLELGIISVSVVGQNDRDTARIMSGVAEVLTEKNALFRSGDERSVEIRVLSGPIIEATPTMEKLLLVTGCGFLSGILLASIFVSIRSMRRLDSHFISDNVPFGVRS